MIKTGLFRIRLLWISSLVCVLQSHQLLLYNGMFDGIEIGKHTSGSLVSVSSYLVDSFYLSRNVIIYFNDIGHDDISGLSQFLSNKQQRK